MAPQSRRQKASFLRVSLSERPYLRLRGLKPAPHALHQQNLQSVVDPNEEEGEFPAPADDPVVLRSNQEDGERDDHARELVEEVSQLVLLFVGIQERHVKIAEGVDEVRNESRREVHLPNPVETEDKADLGHHENDVVDNGEKRVCDRKTLRLIQRFVFPHFGKKNGEGADVNIKQKCIHDKSRQHHNPPRPHYPLIDPHTQGH